MNEESTINLSKKGLLDYVLVEKAKAGDQRAYSELMGRYKDSIYFMLLKMVNNKDDAEDMTIEAFGKAFRNLEQYTPNYAFSTWLFKIATNNCIDFIRRKRENNVSIDSAENDDKQSISVKSNTLDPEEDMINQQKISMMRSVIQKLKPGYQDLIEMRYFKELSYEEIAEELNLPLGTVKAQLYRAREILYDLLKKNHPIREK
jgi:RNA polymerase sigma factor (sigma-70 family)